jgi:hypothetical protein
MSDNYHRTERVYDEEMAPLVSRLVEIAERENMPLFVSAAMTFPNGEVGMCTTALVDLKGENNEYAGAANRVSVCAGLMRGHEGLDRAAGLVISRYHEE